MQREKIDMVGLQLRRAVADRGLESAMAKVVDPDLRDQKDIAPSHTTAGDRLSDRRLVLVNLCGIDMVKAESECGRHHPQDIGRRHSKDSEAERRNRRSIGIDEINVELPILNRYRNSSLAFRSNIRRINLKI